MHNMKNKNNILLAFSALLICAFSFTKLHIPDWEEPDPIDPYMNGKFQHSKNTLWKTKEAFPDLYFDSPIWLRKFPGKNTFLLTLKKGQIWLIDYENGSAISKMLLDIQDQVFNYSDAGFFDVAFHPDFGIPESENGSYIYVSYNYKPENLRNPERYSYHRLSRFTLSMELDIIDPGSELVLIQHFDRHRWHTGGALFFDKYGFLNMSIGDEGGNNDEYGNSQVINNRLFGGILRIDVDLDESRSHAIRRFPTTSPDLPSDWPDDLNQNYYIPNDNPWVSETGDWLEEFFIIGLRSPYTVYYDSINDEVWVADVGESSREEISVMVKGGNGQWPYMEGTIEGPKEKPDSIFGHATPPIYEYDRSKGRAIIGGFLYRGELFPELNEKFIFGDYSSQDVWALDPVTKEVQGLTNTSSSGEGDLGFVSFSTDSFGQIYLVKIQSPSKNAGLILKLLPDETTVSAPLKLSELGAFKDLVSLEPIDGFIPYALNSELYSDNAIKQRWIAIPNDGSYDSPAEQVMFSKEDNWHYPPGTVFIKHFELPISDLDPTLRKRVETRFLIISEDDKSYGLTYKWNEDETDAELLYSSDEKAFTISTNENATRIQKWKFPSRTQCLTCHNANAGIALGPKSHSLNNEIIYPGLEIARNQIEAWNHLNIFSPALSNEEIGSLLKSVSFDDINSNNETKVRSYMDANCSFCHRPGGVEEANFDARFVIPLETQNIINSPTISRNSAQDNSIIFPGDTSTSELFQRIHKIGENQMPPLGRNSVDKEFLRTLKDWILATSGELAAPTTSTTAASNITATTATLNGNITSDGGATITARGFVYATSNTDLIIGATDVASVAVSGTTGVFTENITGLTAGTKYYYRAYATNSVDTTYGAVQSFTTSAPVAPTAPTTSTTAASNITSTTATLNGNITSDGGATITARGFVYATSNTGLIIGATDVASVAVSGTTGVFTENITGLTAGTKYYYRAYATNSVNTTYGEVQSFTTTTEAALSIEDFEQSAVAISPNPTSDILNITSVEKANYRLLNTKGQVLKKGTLTVGKNKIDISSFAKGLYLLKIKTSKGRFTKKVVRD